jgi:hypothetical protein
MLTSSIVQRPSPVPPPPPSPEPSGRSRMRIPDVTMLMSSSRLRACLKGATYSNVDRTSGTSTRSITSISLLSTLR